MKNIKTSLIFFKLPLLIILAVFFTNCVYGNLKYSVEEQDKFIEFVKKLKTNGGDHFTDESIKKAEKYLPILLSMSDEDMKRYGDLQSVVFALGMLSVQLCCSKELNIKNVVYFINNFNNIPNSTIKVIWAIKIFEETKPTDDIVLFIKESIKDPIKAKYIKGGRTKENWEKLKKKLESYNIPVD